jgi:hypothetical protein
MNSSRRAVVAWRGVVCLQNRDHPSSVHRIRLPQAVPKDETGVRPGRCGPRPDDQTGNTLLLGNHVLGVWTQSAARPASARW